MGKLSDIRFEELEGKSFELVQVAEMLCEVCHKLLNTRERPSQRILIATKEDYDNLLRKASIHDRAEIDTEKWKIYFYDHDFPGDVHPECIEKL